MWLNMNNIYAFITFDPGKVDGLIRNYGQKNSIRNYA